MVQEVGVLVVFWTSSMSRSLQQVDKRPDTISGFLYFTLYMPVNKGVTSVCKFCARNAGVDGF